MMTELDNIRERHEKVYIVADDNIHKLLKPLKEDIVYLLNLVKKMEESYYKEHRQ